MAKVISLVSQCADWVKPGRLKRINLLGIAFGHPKSLRAAQVMMAYLSTGAII